MRERINRHHIFYPRSVWQTGQRQRLREHELAIVRMDLDIHNDLHRHLYPLELLMYPQQSSVREMLAYADCERMTSMDGNNSVEDVMHRVSSWADIAQECHDHNYAHTLRQQIPFIERGGYGRV